MLSYTNTIETTSSSVPKECYVCCEKLNKSTRKLITCSCNFVQCNSCVEKYLLSLTFLPHCMNCRKEWDVEFLSTHLTKHFLFKKYKLHRETMLFERERSMFPETMPFVERERQREELSEKINEFNKEWRIIRDKKHSLSDNITFSELSVEDKINYYRKKKDFEIEEQKIMCEISFLQKCIQIYDNRENNIVEARKFIRACPVNDCRGFLSTQWKCGLCNTWTCPQCHEVIGLDKGANHTCLEENLKTAELLAKDSRPCPKCATLIFRISGCPVMFCTQCHTGFDWNTGRTHNGPIHNPHYFDYIRSRGGDGIPQNEVLDDNACNMPDIRQLMLLENKIFGIHSNNTMMPIYTYLMKNSNTIPFSILKIVEIYNHIQDQIIRDLTPPRNIANMNRDLRILYLMDRLPEDKFKILLQQREKKENKKHDNLLVCEMFSQTCIDLVRRFFREAKTKEQHEQFVNEYNELKEYVKECLNKIGSNYKCVPLRFHHTW